MGAVVEATEGAAYHVRRACGAAASAISYTGEVSDERGRKARSERDEDERLSWSLRRGMLDFVVEEK
jgi:hypothetical protein